MKQETKREEESSTPSNKLAHEIVTQLLECDESGENKVLIKLLIQFRNKKHPNYQKFTNYIQQQLNRAHVQLLPMTSIIKHLGTAVRTSNNSMHQIKSISDGIKNYLTKEIDKGTISDNIHKLFVNQLINQYFLFQYTVCILVCKMISYVTHRGVSDDKVCYQQQIYKKLVQYIKTNPLTQQNCYKCCHLIHEMSLQKYFKVHQLINMISKINLNTQFFIDKNGNYMMDLIEGFIVKQSQNSPKKIVKLIDEFALNPMDYPKFIKVLNKKSIRYYLNQQPIFSIDLKVKGRPDIIKNLIEILIEQGKKKEALHFINKYYVTEYYHLNQNENRMYNKNVLQKFDEFLPTENILGKVLPNSKYCQMDYLTLKQLDYQKQDVVFVDRSNLTRDILDNILLSPEFGIDCQASPVYSTFEKGMTEIVQIALDYERKLQIGKLQQIKLIYILDLPQLIHETQFAEWFFHELCHSYKGIIVGQAVRSDFHKFCNLIKVSNKNYKQNIQIEKLKFMDIAEIFKKNKNQLKCSLEYITFDMIHKKLSKFQQCSGWHNRPLRLAQLHYAALDAALPLKIYRMMKKLSRI